jgi:hypothetical protein
MVAQNRQSGHGKSEKNRRMDKMTSSTYMKVRRFDVTTIQIKSYNNEWMSG